MTSSSTTQPTPRIRAKRPPSSGCPIGWSWKALGASILLVLFLGAFTRAQADTVPDPSPLRVLEERKLVREIQKLDDEHAKFLKDAQQEAPPWLTALLGFLGGAAAAAVSAWGIHRASRGALDQAVHEERIRAYPKLVNAGRRLALYFPMDGSVGPKECRGMGRAMSRWYFDTGGLLLSGPARDAYFRLARALTRASRAQTLSAPAFPTDIQLVSTELVTAYRGNLALSKRTPDQDDNWQYGQAAANAAPHQRFADFVFLQWLASNLRTALSEDLLSRRRPK